MYSKVQIKNLNEEIKTDFPHLFPIEDNDHLHYEGVSRMVMLDRYSQKDDTLKTLKVGDLVLTIIKDDLTFPTRGIGNVLEIRDDNKCIIVIENQYAEFIDSEIKLDNSNLILKNKNDLVKPMELYFEQIARRVGNYLGKNESSSICKDFIQELTDLNYIPAGRVLYGAGSNKQVTYFNCYVMPYIHDSREGISKHRSKVAEIMSRGGGVGTNGSTLRPKGAPALDVGGNSSGAVSWLNDLSSLTHLIEQGGSRRGAQMIMLADWHPDIIEFVISKIQNIDSLLHIKQNFNSSLIQEEVKRRIVFKNFDVEQQNVYKQVVANYQLFDSEIVSQIKKKIIVGGKYEINNPDFLTGANISVSISDQFMEAVEKDLMWELKFPDNLSFTPEQKIVYESQWAEIGNVFEWENMGYPVKIWNKIRARELWELINFCATYSAEPGIFFIDRANAMTNARGYDQKVVATNPCGEQPLAPNSVCNLGAINLANFIDKESHCILSDKLKQTVKTAVRLQDNIIDYTPYFLEENKSQALGERRIGLGVMNLHDMLIWANKRYGSEEGNKFIDELFSIISTSAYEASIELAQEKGSFPFLVDREKFVNTSGFLQNMPEFIREGILKNGIRNSHLLTVAPTGSTGTMIGGSTGLEPYFAFSYFRSGRLGKFMEIKVPIIDEWLKLNPKYNDKNLPDIFVNAMQLTPEEHVDVQCSIQRWIDSSISKTVNAPKGYKVKQVQEIYMNLYKKGAKGGTVYVDGSRDSQVLSLEKEENLFSEEFTKQGIGLAKIGSEEVAFAVGLNVGDTCSICWMGTLMDFGGCVTCNNCQAQIRCGL